MLIIFFPAIASFYQIYYMSSVFKYESPKWLIDHGRIDEARNALGYVYTDKGIDIGISRLQGSQDASTNIDSPLLNITNPTYSQIFCSKSFRKMLRLSLVLNIGQQAVGSMAIFLYSTSIFEEMGGGKFFARFLTVVLGSCMVISGFFSIYLLGRYGRKSILIFGQIFIVLFLFSLGASTTLIDLSINIRAVLLFLYVFVYTFSMSSTFWAYVGEICNNKCLSIGVCANLSTVVTFSFLFPVAQNLIGVSSCFFIFSALSLILLVYEIIEVFETRGLTKQEIISKITR